HAARKRWRQLRRHMAALPKRGNPESPLRVLRNPLLVYPGPNGKPMSRLALSDGGILRTAFFRTLSIAIVVAVTAAVPAARAADETCQIAASAISEASKIRNLNIKKKVPCFVHDKEQVKKYLLHAIETKIPPEKLRMEAIVYKALGFIPQ